MIDCPEIKALREFKKAFGWSYQAIAEKIGVHQQAIVAWFAGKWQPNNLSRQAIRKFLKKYASGQKR
jgi:transcriptional regulator with XRE-family HTH domain